MKKSLLLSSLLYISNEAIASADPVFEEVNTSKVQDRSATEAISHGFSFVKGCATNSFLWGAQKGGAAVAWFAETAMPEELSEIRKTCKTWLQITPLQATAGIAIIVAAAVMAYGLVGQGGALLKFMISGLGTTSKELFVGTIEEFKALLKEGKVITKEVLGTIPSLKEIKTGLQNSPHYINGLTNDVLLAIKDLPPFSKVLLASNGGLIFIVCQQYLTKADSAPREIVALKKELQEKIASLNLENIASQNRDLLKKIKEAETKVRQAQERIAILDMDRQKEEDQKNAAIATKESFLEIERRQTQTITDLRNQIIQQAQKELSQNTQIANVELLRRRILDLEQTSSTLMLEIAQKDDLLQKFKEYIQKSRKRREQKTRIGELEDGEVASYRQDTD